MISSNKFKFSIAITLFIILIIILYASFALNVDNTLSKDDIVIIKQLDLDKNCKLINTFIEELNCIKETQEKIQSTIVDEDFYTEEFGGNCRKKFSAEPKEFMERGYGCCVQYSRLIEKSLNYYNFETRHIFLISPYKDISLSNFLPLGQQSHAVTEVLTSKGWMGIDSILPVIVAINENGKFKVYKYADIINNKKSKEIFPNNDFYHQNLDLIYGLYSRHGYFYGPNLPGPEFNLRQILYNF